MSQEVINSWKHTKYVIWSGWKCIRNLFLKYLENLQILEINYDTCNHLLNKNDNLNKNI